MMSSIDTIMAQTCERFIVTPADLRGPCREKTIMRARMAAMYALRTTSQMSYPAIGRIFGHRHHTSVMNAVRNVPELLGADPEFQEKVVAIIGAAVAANYARAEAMRGGVFRSVRAGQIRTPGRSDPDTPQIVI